MRIYRPGRPRAGRYAQWAAVALSLAAAFAAGRWAASRESAIAAALARWSERPADAGAAPQRAELGRRKRAYFERLEATRKGAMGP